MRKVFFLIKKSLFALSWENPTAMKKIEIFMLLFVVQEFCES